MIRALLLRPREPGRRRRAGAGAQGVGYPAARVGENIAEGQGTAAEVMDGWMGSPRHRDHILALSFREIGIGVAFGKNARGWEIVWVQVFGLPRGDSGPHRRSPRCRATLASRRASARPRLARARSPAADAAPRATRSTAGRGPSAASRRRARAPEIDEMSSISPQAAALGGSRAGSARRPDEERHVEPLEVAAHGAGLVAALVAERSRARARPRGASSSRRRAAPPPRPRRRIAAA